MIGKKMFYDMGDGIHIDLSKVTGFKKQDGKYWLAFGDSLNPLPYVFEEKDFERLLVHLRIFQRSLPEGVKVTQIASPTTAAVKPVKADDIKIEPLRKSPKKVENKE